MVSVEEQEKAADHMKYLMALDEGLYDSEIRWLDKFRKQWLERGFLSENQIEIIYKIYYRRMG